MKITEVLEKKDTMSEKEILENLTKCGLKLRESLDVCRIELGEKYNKEKFEEAALRIRVDSLPVNSHFGKNGETVVENDWED